MSISSTTNSTNFEFANSAFDQLLGCSPIACLLADPSCYLILDANAAAAALLGQTRDELKKLTLSEVLMPAHWETLRRAMADRLTAPRIEESYARANGGSSILVLTHQPCKVEDREACLVFLYDVTDTVENAQRAMGRSQKEIERERIAREHAALTWDRLASNRELLLTFLEHAPLSAYVKDNQGRYLFHNRFAKTLCSFTDESVGKTDSDLFPIDVAEQFRRNDLAVLAAGVPIQSVETLAEAGQERHFLSVKFPIQDEQRNVYVGGMSIEITEKMRADAERHSLNQLLDVADQPIVALDLSDSIIFWNKGAERLYGFGQEEAFGRNMHELLRTSFPEPLGEIERKFLEQGQWAGELVQRSKDGTEIIVASRWSAPRDLQGQRYGRLELNTDITAIRKAALALQKSEKRLHAIAETLPHFIWTAMPLGTSTFITSRWYEYTGYAPEQDWTVAVHPDDLPKIWQAGNLAVAGKEQFTVEFRMMRSSDKTYRWHRADARPLFDERGEVREWVGVTSDIHDLKLTELEGHDRERITGAAQMANSLAEEITNPLTALSNLIYLLGAEEMPARPSGYVRQASETIARINLLVRSINQLYLFDAGAREKEISDKDARFTPGMVVQSSGVYSVFHPSTRSTERTVLLRAQHFPACICCGKRCTYQLVHAAAYIFEDEDFRR